jgi:hypothetical protein
MPYRRPAAKLAMAAGLGLLACKGKEAEIAATLQGGK